MRMYNNNSIVFLNKDVKCAQVNILKAKEFLTKMLIDFRSTIPRFYFVQISQHHQRR